MMTKAQIVRALLAVAVAVIAALLYGIDAPTVSVSAEMRSTTIAHGEVFFTTDDVDYSAGRRAAFDMVPDGSWHRYAVPLPSGAEIDRIRLDPGSGPGTVAVRSIELRYGNKRYRFDGSSLPGALGVLHEVRLGRGPAQALTVTSLGPDPNFELRVPGASRSAAFASLRDLAIAAASTFVLWMLLELVVARSAGRVRRLRADDGLLRRTCAAVSDPVVLVVDGRMLLTLASIGLLAALYIGMRLNQSSIGIWDSIYPSAPAHQVQEPGTPKYIRVDEWKVLTPWVLNQAMHGGPVSNRNVGGDDSPLLAAVPVNDALTLPQLKFAGFRFLGIERGMSWWWAYKSFGLVFSFFWLCLLLTRGNLAASLLGTAWVYASSFTQWWFSSNMPEIMIAFALGTVGAIYAIHSSKRGLIFAGCALMFYAAANLLLHLYPPFIVPLAYLALAIVVGYAIEQQAPRLLVRHAGFRTAAVALTCVAIGAYAYAFATTAADTIHAMRNTVYPGQRVSTSGGVPLLKVAYGFFEPFRFDERQIPLPPSNASEASSFVLLWPLILLVVPWRALTRRSGAMLAAFCCFGVLAVCWIAVDLPRPIEQLLQWLGWSLVTPKRTVLAFGVGSILACTVLFARSQGAAESAPRIRRHAAIVVVLAAVALLGWKLHQSDAVFFTWKILLIGVVACGLTTAGLVFGRTRLLVAGLVIYALAPVVVNPLESGTRAISTKPILLAAKSAGDRVGDKWMVIGDTTFAQGLKAQGLDVFAGSQFLPDRNGIAVLDPTGAYRSVWDRYATVRMDSEPNRRMPLFTKIYGDQYSVRLDVCGPQARRLGITHVAYTAPVPAPDLRCLRPLPAPQNVGVKLFRLR